MKEFYDIGKEIEKAGLIERLCNMNPDFTYCNLDEWAIDDLKTAIQQHNDFLDKG